jgi:transcriptional regulator with XRE-family HTH domain
VDFWNNVKYYSKERGMSQKELAERLDINPRTFDNWIYRDIHPSFIVLVKIAEILNVSVDTLLTGKTTFKDEYNAAAQEVDKLLTENKRLKEIEEKYYNLVNQIKQIKIDV